MRLDGNLLEAVLITVHTAWHACVVWRIFSVFRSFSEPRKVLLMLLRPDPLRCLWQAALLWEARDDLLRRHEWGHFCSFKIASESPSSGPGDRIAEVRTFAFRPAVAKSTLAPVCSAQYGS